MGFLRPHKTAQLKPRQERAGGAGKLGQSLGSQGSPSGAVAGEELGVPLVGCEEAEVDITEPLGCPQLCPFLPNPFLCLSHCIPLPGTGRAEQGHFSFMWPIQGSRGSFSECPACVPGPW